MAADPFALLPIPEDRDVLLRLAWLACSCREQSIHLANIGGWILPTTSLPWCPRKARTLRQVSHHVERVRGILQTHVDHFPTMTADDARAWVADCHKHHGSGSWPCWWSAGVVGIAEQITRLARRF